VLSVFNVHPRGDVVDVLQVVQHTMSLLGTLTELQPELSSVMLSSPGLGPALEFSLLHTPERLVRKEVSTGVLRMALSLRKKSKVVPTVLMQRVHDRIMRFVYPVGCCAK